MKEESKNCSADQVDALNWAKGVFEKMDPHTKQDIEKFQKKIVKVD